MCKHKFIGDYYRGCGHFHGQYYTGDVQDCNDPSCATSKAHKHKTAKNCGCPAIVIDDAKIRNMFRQAFEGCKPANTR